MKKEKLSEIIANSVTHGVGVALSIAALVILVVFASLQGDAWKIVSFSIYGATLVMLYTASTLYHSFTEPTIKKFFRRLDHSAIYLLIAGTYTPITLISMHGAWGWTLFGLIWGLAITGIFFSVFFIGRFQKLSVLIYILMGWLVVIAVKPLIQMLSVAMLIWLSIGGFCYTFGVIFYVWKKLPYNHAIWHLFVLGGSISHFLGMLFCLI